VNCCHLAATNAALLAESNYDRARFASGVARELIRGGVRCVIAAGWAVDDEAASVFARMFYKKLLAGARFIDAVAAARTEARTRGGNTWAAYQCYGDPDWQFRRNTSDAQRPAGPPTGQEFASIASAAALIVALQRIAVESEFQRAKPIDQEDRLRYLESTHAPFWRHRGDVAAAFGHAWSRAGFFNEAITWYERARTAQDGSGSLAAIEQLANIRIRAALNRADEAGRSAGAVAAARKEIEEGLALLDSLTAVSRTFERENLYGSTYKRIALLEAAAGREEAARKAIDQMRQHYGAAETMARTAPPEQASRLELFYPAMNRIAAQLALGNASTSAEVMDDETVTAIRASMLAATPNFWSVVGQTELDMYVALSRGGLAQALGDLHRKFSDHHAQVSGPRMWASVLDTARLVLSAYQKGAPHAEAEAAGRVLEHLAGLAGREPSTKPRSTGGSRAARGTSRPRVARKRRPKRASAAAGAGPRRPVRRKRD
jgi:tetratricopeptide (TPR) repeat protein